MFHQEGAAGSEAWEDGGVFTPQAGSGANRRSANFASFSRTFVAARDKSGVYRHPLERTFAIEPCDGMMVLITKAPLLTQFRIVETVTILQHGA